MDTSGVEMQSLFRRAIPFEALLREASRQIKEIYPPDRHRLIDTLAEFIMPTLLGPSIGIKKKALPDPAPISPCRSGRFLP